MFDNVDKVFPKSGLILLQIAEISPSISPSIGIRCTNSILNIDFINSYPFDHLEISSIANLNIAFWRLQSKKQVTRKTCHGIKSRAPTKNSQNLDIE